MFNVSEEEFHLMVDEALETIPQGFKDKLSNIVFIVEDIPSESDLARLSLDDYRSLLGLYSGTPYTHRGHWYAGTVPDRIILFQKNIERLCNSRQQLSSKIREVMVHEIAHYFGMNEDEIREAGY
jgi:predicted Zn-dependent protease with MMP-like domain